MITPAYVATMARYNRWRNAATLAEAEGVGEAARRLDRGAFFGSIHGTLSHLLWADAMWMSRFDGAPAPDCAIEASAAFAPDWTALKRDREALDDRIADWAGRVEQAWLDAPLRWWSGAAGREMERPAALCVAHLFNHQTHHRGQAHAMLTAAGARTAPTDLPFLPEPV